MYVPATPNANLTRSWSRCHAALFGDPTMPPKAWEHNLAGYLFERGYHVDSIRIVLDHCAIHNTVQGCPELSFSALDRRHVERLLPGRPAAWAANATAEAAEFGPAFA